MDKLVELLNEYERSKGTNLEITNWECVYGNLSYFGYGNGYSEFLCISKRYGFIEWLVDNDKIEPLRKFIGWETDEDEPYIQFDLVDQYIAYLSIQDNPIEFLISILK